MATFISTQPGVVVRLQQPWASTPFAIRFGLDTSRAIVTQVALDHQGGFQFMHSIQDMVHISVFGERMGEMQIGGLTFLQACNGGGDGIADVLSYYNNNRVTARGAPATIQLGSVPYQGFLTGVHLDIVKPEAPLGQWAFRFANFLK